MATTNMEVSVLLSLKDKLTRPLKSMGDGFKRMGSTLRASQKDFDALSKKMDKAGARAVKIGKKLSTRVTLPILGMGVAAIKMGVDFNKGMANVSTLIDGNIPRTQALGKAMLKLSTDTGVATGDLSKGLYEVISAFGDSTETVDRMRIVTKAATAGLATTTESLNLLSAVTKGYGDTSAKAMKASSDMAFITVKLGQTSFPQLARAMGQVVPLAKTMNVSQKELFATMATLTGVTGTASEVATQMRAALQAMMKPSTEMAAAIKSLGFDSADAAIKQLGFVGAMQKVAATTGGNKEKMGKLFTQVEGLNAVFALTGAQATNFKDKLEQMGKASGATDKAFKSQTEGVNKAGFSWKKMVATMKAMAINVGQILMPVMEAFANILGAVFSVINSLPGPVKTVIVALAGIAAAIGPVFMLFGAYKKLRIMIKMTKLAFKTMSKTMMKSPMMAKFLVITAIIGGIISLFKKSTISITENADASKSLSSEVDQLAAAYDKTGKAVKKLTVLQKAQMKLKLMEAGEKAQKEMTKNLEKQAQILFAMGNADVGSDERKKLELQMQILKESQKMNVRTVQKAGIAMGDTKQQAQVRASLAVGAATDDLSGVNKSALKDLGLGGTLAPMAQQLIMASQKEVKGQINIHIKSDGTTSATASFPGSKIGAAVSAQSSRNGSTR